ncbi:MAG: hypothetical protein OEL57_01405 [Trichlorobacter sp.]|uniref:hypothetical protein n=1 Tax=Trichlorobacter sp. TaxID=2911007 RepID=UPI00256BDF3A|nr:hypothetical protein [Trichlorobacter sp.]MDK9716546.1 hypothetical protein [Trichlorobacter sp.]
MASYEQTFLEQITHLHGQDFSGWQGWQLLMEWIKRQPWKLEFFGEAKIPARMLHPPTLVTELTRFLEGAPEPAVPEESSPDVQTQPDTE